MNLKFVDNIANLLSRSSNSNSGLKSLYAFIYKGNKLSRDLSLNEVLQNGYEGNPDGFSIISKLASMFSNIEFKAYINDNEVDDPLALIFENNNTDITLTEFKKAWYTYAMSCGEALIHVVRLNGGNNAGKIVKLPILLPPQFTEIEFGNFMNPILNYKLEMDETIPIDPKEVYHTRIFLNTDTTEGRHLRGLSPLRVAANIIESQNNGYNLQSQASKTGMPPGIIVDESQDGQSETRQKGLERAWKRKQNNPDRKVLPVFAGGKITYIELGYKSLKDLDLIESSKHGLRILCNVYGVPSQLFNDPENKAFNNEKSGARRIYTNRILPDAWQFCEVLNKIMKAYGVTYKPDITEITDMQDDPIDRARLLLDGSVKGAVTENEFRISAGLEELDNDQLDELRVNRDRLSINEITMNNEAKL